MIVAARRDDRYPQRPAASESGRSGSFASPDRMARFVVHRNIVINQEGGGGPRDRRPAARAIFAYIEGFYNRTRRRSAIGYISPIEMELKAAKPCPFLRRKITEIIELSEGVSQGSESSFAECAAVFPFDLAFYVAPFPIILKAQRRQHDTIGALIVPIGGARDDAGGLELIDELLHRLLTGAHCRRQRGLAYPRWPDMGEHRPARFAVPGKAARFHSDDEIPLPVLRGAPQREANVIELERPIIVKYLDHHSISV